MEVALLVVGLVAVTFGRPRLQFLGLVLIANLDLAGALNTVKHVGVVGVAAVRVSYVPMVSMRISRSAVRPAKWLALFVVVLAAGAVVGNHAAGAKLTVSILVIAVLTVVLRRLDERGAISPRTVRQAAYLSIGLGILATSAGVSGDLAGRLTSFINAQQYAAILVALVCLLLRAQAMAPARSTVVAGLATTVTIVLTGSRSAVVGLVAAFGIYVAWRLRRRWQTRHLIVPTMIFGAGLIFVAALAIGGSTHVRAFESLGLLTGERANIGTFNLRSDITGEVLHELDRRPISTLLVGTGAGSGVAAVERAGVFGHAIHLDPNRAVHNEWLRTTYEFGVLGLVALAGLVLGTVRRARTMFRSRRPEALLALPAIVGLPTILAFLTTENVLASASSGAGFAIAVTLGCLRHAEVATRSVRSAATSRT